MAVLYVTETGAQVRREGERLAVWKGKKKLHTLPAYDLHQMVLFGNIGITPAAMHTALMQGIDLVLLSTTGSYRGRLVGPQGRNVILRQMQYRRYEDEDFRLGAARGFVSGKIRNMRTLIMRLARRRNRDIAHTAQRLRALLKQIDRIDNADALRGIEGAATATYFGALSQFLPTAFPFVKRTRRPPKDAVNAMLSFGYTLLSSGLESAVLRVGLDPYIGYLHLVDYGRPSLALDMMEEFRPIIVDAMVLDLLNHGQIKKEDFEQRDGGVFLCGDGRQQLIRAYQDRVATKVQYLQPSGQVQKVPYRQCFELQARRLIRMLRGEDTAYQPFLIR
ncbi:MAG: CRISPR-associated endonuclease Cas1 [Gemmatimonadota bacterium]|nr:CRISPR-associated endonuclease Cas1 [Gemmatimonadota bacterium]